MAPASRLPQLRWIPWAACLLAAVLGFALFVHTPWSGSSAPARSRERPAAAVWLEPTHLAGADWSILSPVAGMAVAGGPLAGRFRLAGTFLEYGDEAAPERRKAVLDDAQTGVQSILGEGDAIDSILIARVFIDHVTLRTGDREEELWMTFSRGGSGAAAADAGTNAVASGVEGAGGPADRFGGRRVGENRWTFERSGLMSYYRELMDQPERLVKVFDSLRPLYDDESKITGYELHVEGEPEFFDAVGFREGDVVRRVNSTDMTNRRRAEAFIKQFVEGRATAFVIDIERGGQPQKLIYQSQ